MANQTLSSNARKASAMVISVINHTIFSYQWCFLWLLWFCSRIKSVQLILTRQGFYSVWCKWNRLLAFDPLSDFLIRHEFFYHWNSRWDECIEVIFIMEILCAHVHCKDGQVAYADLARTNGLSFIEILQNLFNFRELHLNICQHPSGHNHPYHHQGNIYCVT